MGKHILLIEPSYLNKYPPLGLMKLAAYHGPRGRGDGVCFVKGETADVLLSRWDRVYVATLFSFEWERTSRAIDFAIQAAGNRPDRVFVGGIAASLMHPEFTRERRWQGVRFIKGLLDRAPAVALGLAPGTDFGSEDVDGVPIEQMVPDYGILDQVRYQYPVRDAYFGYASRGCVRKCSFCGVPQLEGAQRESPSLPLLVQGVDEAHGVKMDLVLMDNNITASARFQEVIAEIRHLGFTPGATLERNGRRRKRRVDFNQGVDARILAKSLLFLRELATICLSPLRIAFDHLGLRQVYERSVRMAADRGISSLSNYLLYNFMDTPRDLYERMRLNIALNEALGIRIWSFPMRYQPVTLKDRSHVGKHWNRYQLRSFQIMLQASRGIVSGNPSFFRWAYGDDPKSFEHLLGLPHAFLFQREHYHSGEGRGVREEYEALRRHLSERQHVELLRLLSNQSALAGARRRPSIRLMRSRTRDRAVGKLFDFHLLPLEKRPEGKEVFPLPLFPALTPSGGPQQEEFVEDAGLFEPAFPESS